MTAAPFPACARALGSGTSAGGGGGQGRRSGASLQRVPGARVAPGRGRGHGFALTGVVLSLDGGHQGKLGVIACLLLLAEHVPLGPKQLLDLPIRGVRVLSDDLGHRTGCGETAEQRKPVWVLFCTQSHAWLSELSTWRLDSHIVKLRPRNTSKRNRSR